MYGINTPAVSGSLPLTPGNVGELIQGVVLRASAVSLTSTTAANVTSIALTTGVWLISGAVCFTPAASTSVTVATYSVSATTATLAANTASASANTSGEILMAQSTAANVYGADISFTVPTYYYNCVTAGTLYLVVNSTFSVSTNKACGFLAAVRCA